VLMLRRMCSWCFGRLEPAGVPISCTIVWVGAPLSGSPQARKVAPKMAATTESPRRFDLAPLPLKEVGEVQTSSGFCSRVSCVAQKSEAC